VASGWFCGGECGDENDTERLRREWQALSAKARRALSAVIVLAIALALPAMLYWFAGEHERLARRVAEADARFEGLQAAVSEIERLHREATAPPEPAAEETVGAAFRSAGLAMDVKREGADRCAFRARSISIAP